MTALINNILSISDNKFIKTLLVILIALIAQLIAKFLLSIIFNNKIGHIGGAKPNHVHYQRRRLKTIGSLARALAIFIIWFIAILVILSIYNVPIAPLLTSAGLVGAGLAFGMQSLIKDFVSGAFIIFENQYRVDDYIELEKVSGRVEKITMRSTALRDDNGSLHYIPNGSIIITTNLSMGKLHISEPIAFSRDISFIQLKNKIQKISHVIAEDPELSMVVKEGPVVKSLDELTKDKLVASIGFVTTPSKRKNAMTIIMSQIEKAKLPLA